MDLYTTIKNSYPAIDDDQFVKGFIQLRDDGDGVQYIAKWEYEKPIPDGLTLGK